MKLSFDFNGLQMSASDFPRTLQGWLAFSIAFAAATQCKDKEAALELLLHTADDVIEKVKEGRVP